MRMVDIDRVTLHVLRAAMRDSQAGGSRSPPAAPALSHTTYVGSQVAGVGWRRRLRWCVPCGDSALALWGLSHVCRTQKN